MFGKTMSLGQCGERVQCCEQKPTEPDAFATAPFADAIHSIIPVAGAHKGKAMLAGGQALVERQCAVFEKTRFTFGNRSLKKGIMIFCAQCGSLNKCNHLRQNGGIAGYVNILRNGICKPHSVVCHARTKAAVRLRQPPML